jgi:nicotinamide riboside kinase
MRVAFAGTHRTGKTTLVDAVAALLPAHEAIEEPYRALEEAGHEFSDPPSVEDFERQLRHAIEAVAGSGADTLFDRSPLDLVAYLQALDEDFDLDDWLDDLRTSMASLDLVVVLSIETPDRIPVPAHEDRRLRRRVDERLRTLLLDDPHDFGTRTVEVSGSLDDRIRQVMAAISGD